MKADLIAILTRVLPVRMRRAVSANRGRPRVAGAEVVEAEEREVPDAAIDQLQKRPGCPEKLAMAHTEV